MGLREKLIVSYFPEFDFSFSVAQVLVGLRKQLVNNLFFPDYACAAGFNNNDNNQLIKTFYFANEGIETGTRVTNI